MDRIPSRLNRDTIVEAIFELRFTSKTDSVADILPGLLFQHVSQSFPKIERLGVTQLPTPLLQSNANLRYAPHYKLVGNHYNLQVGEHVFSISCPRPYSGWDEFRKKIHDLIRILRNTKLIDDVERFSVKYVNVIPADGKTPMDQLRVKLQAGPFDLGSRATHLRTEIIEDDFLNIVQISSQITAKLSETEVVEGVLVDIDTICQRKFTDIWNEFSDLLEDAHTTEKKIFFNLLQKRTIEQLEPQW